MNTPKISLNEIEKIRDLYFGNTKHASYQPVPKILEPFFPDLQIDARWRHPGPRIELLKDKLSNFEIQKVVEIGSNTGFQAIELARQFPSYRFECFEISQSHVEFIRFCIKLDDTKNIEVYNSEFQHPESEDLLNNVTFLDFNVVHHAGSDFLNEKPVDIEYWWSTVLPNWLSNVTIFPNYWFSSGFRLGGSLEHPLSNPQSPSEFIKLIINCVKKIDENIMTDVYVIAFDDKINKLFYRKLNYSHINSIDQELAELRMRKVYRGEYFTRPIFHFYQNAR